ncbi:M48 family metalloprotease [Halostella sp. PRR32]|uniref:M48 family metallopeptidase n=1 Tax=Halostella sp. PRR32 TaxID=3098147 RepID=UPI002B1E633C|nr:M48 family metalloprotease [Halostella sp. PRR32]
MRRLVARILMATVGLGLLGVYLAVGLVVVEMAAWLFAVRPDPWVLVGGMVGSALVFGYTSYRAGAKRIVSGLGAVELPRSRAPWLYRRLDRLSAEMDAGNPSIYVAALPAPNALAVGAGEGVVVLDRDLFRILDGDEMEAILAHELAHLETRDALLQTLGSSLVQTVSGVLFVLLLPVGLVVAGVQRATAWLLGRRPDPFDRHLVRIHLRVAQFVLVFLLALTLALRAHSRRRELAADDRAVAVTGDPLALARALTRIQRASRPRHGPLSSLYIYGQEEEDALARLLATHPPMDDRIERMVERAERTPNGTLVR